VVFSVNRGARAMKAFRLERGLTQAQAAVLCGIDPQLWARYERGDTEPGLKNAARIQHGTEKNVLAVWFTERGGALVEG
jgi:transcriptional regulator with XRE-family HTH domain